MLDRETRPKSIDGIKRLAKELRKERDIKHCFALDLAAQAASFANFRHARHALHPEQNQTSSAYVLLTRYWLDKEQKKSGRETLKIDLPIPLLDMLEKTSIKKVSGFTGLRQVAEDHFVCDTLDPSQSYSRRTLCAAERSIRFMQHTGLRPFSDKRISAAIDSLPNSDHSTLWIDPWSNQPVIVDEPYSGAPNELERAAWAASKGWHLTKTSWPGMYNPYSCDLYLATDGHQNFDFEALVRKVEAMPLPLIETDWDGDSSQTLETFLSPLAKTKQDIRRARCKGTIFPTDSATTLPYRYSMGSSKRRPIGELGVAGHTEAGRILKAICLSGHLRYSAYSRISSLRYTLEDWMSMEIKRGELEGSDFFEVYYTNVEKDAPYIERAKSQSATISMLGDLKNLLVERYANCAPLRKQTKRIDMAIRLISKAT